MVPPYGAADGASARRGDDYPREPSQYRDRSDRREERYGRGGYDGPRTDWRQEGSGRKRKSDIGEGDDMDDRSGKRWRSSDVPRGGSMMPQQQQQPQGPPTAPRAFRNNDHSRGPRQSGGRGGRGGPMNQHGQYHHVDHHDQRNGYDDGPKQEIVNEPEKAITRVTAAWIPDIEVEEDDDQLLEVQKIMGFAGFKSTSNKQVPGNHKNYGVKKEKQTQYRQYMNRVGGFNRPLSPPKD